LTATPTLLANIVPVDIFATLDLRHRFFELRLFLFGEGVLFLDAVAEGWDRAPAYLRQQPMWSG
jgi:hypothetical protein